MTNFASCSKIYQESHARLRLAMHTESVLMIVTQAKSNTVWRMIAVGENSLQGLGDALRHSCNRCRCAVLGRRARKLYFSDVLMVAAPGLEPGLPKGGMQILGLARSSKCLARTNKSRARAEATKKRRMPSRRIPSTGSQHHARLARRSANVRVHYRRNRIPSGPLRRTPSRELGTSSVAEEALEDR